MFAFKNSLFRMRSVQPSLSLAFRSNTSFAAACVAGANRAFSTGSISSGATKLGRALEKEIKYENDNYTQLEDIETYLNDSGFQFSEQANGIMMTLSKTVGDKKVEIVFEARQPVPEEEPLDDED